MDGPQARQVTVEAAPAKINLALHVTGQRDDGYHLLETLATFTAAGDTVSIREAAAADTVSVHGPFSAMLAASGTPDSNLVVKARDLLRDTLMAAGTKTPPVAIDLHKSLPVAAGIGGGSADAAATLRALMRHWNARPDDETLAAIALRLGADVPMCLESRPLIARGIGETTQALAFLPSFALVLLNPLVGVSTAQIFKRLQTKTNAPLPLIADDASTDWTAVIFALRNDLQPPAMALLPSIGDSLRHLHEEGALLCRMSGSGATCFGLFASPQAANRAEAALRRRRPAWYVQATTTQPGWAKAERRS